MDEVASGFRLSPQQRRQLRFDGPAAVPRARMVMELSGEVDPARLTAALATLTARHEILRTVFRRFPGVAQPLQVVLATAAIAPLGEEGLDLARGPLLGARLEPLRPGQWRFELALPALLADHAGLSNLARELAAVYGGAGTGVELPSYAQVAELANELLEGEDGEAGRAFWRGRGLASLGAALLPYGVGAALPGEAERGRAGRALDGALAAALAGLAAGAERPLAVAVLTGWRALLARLSGEPEPMVGVLAEGRELEVLAPVVGPLSRYLPVVGPRLLAAGFERAVVDTAAAWREALAWQDAFSPELLEPRGAEDGGWSATFRSAEHGAELLAGGVVFQLLEAESAVDHTRLELALTTTSEGCRCELSWAPGWLSPAEGEDLLARLVALLRAAVAAPRCPLAALSLMTDAELRELPAAPAPALSRDGGSLFPALVARVAADLPERPAVVMGEEVLSFAELEERAARLAHHLRELGAGPEVPVGLLLERSPAMIVGLYAILKAGAVLLPLDLALPAARLERMLTAAGARLLVSRGAWAALVPAAAVRLVEVDSPLPALTSPLPAPPLDPENLAYVLYTSGSTGEPKAVMVRHRGLAHLGAALEERVYTHLGELAGRVSVNAPLQFDASVKQWLQLCHGRTLDLVPEEVRPDGEKLRAHLARRAVGLLDCTPTQLAALVAAGLTSAGPFPAALLVGGEAVPGELWQALAGDPGRRSWNVYGPTETTVDATAAAIAPGTVPTLGEPLSRVWVQLLDDHSAPLPPGAAGEIAIGGEGLARGYLGSPALTAARFVPDPGAGRTSPAGSRLYLTGDRGRRRLAGPGGITFLGRRDHQVKVRGVRIELGEIEAALCQSPRVERAVVTVFGEAGERLVAYVVPAGGSAASPELGPELRAFLRQRLPEPMVPADVVVLAELPVNRNGKVDRHALPPPGGGSEEGRPRSLEPRNAIERRVAEIWGRALGREGVGIDDNFFDLGGHSLLLVRVFDELRAAFGSELSMLEMFHHPTVRELAALLTREGGQGVPEAAARELPAAGPGDIAILALAGRFPKAASVDELWQLLCRGEEGITFFRPDELAAAGVAPELLADPAYVPARGVLAGVERFDAAFFGFTPREATLTDPQQRLFLETAWEALERAGHAPGRGAGAVGVFGGSGVNAYLLRNLMSNPEVARSAGLFQTLIHNRNDHLAARVAYKLDLKGPAITVQTACSTSLVAVALACQSLRDGHSDLALAGGVTIGLPQQAGYLWQEGSIDSPDGHCRPFDAAARGTLDGSGVGVVVLRRLADAQADGDPIVAVIKGWGLNNDGAAKAGYTTPSLAGQAEVIAMAHTAAGIEAGSIGYVEAHGTGTPLGDPIEVAALTRAFGSTPSARGCIALGSLKGNLGHLDAAAGVAGLIKAALCLEREAIPKTLHFAAPNPELGLEASPFHVPTALLPWPRGRAPRRAGVSAFGIGGTNAHLVLEEAPPRAAGSPARPWQLLQLSARTASALERASAELAAHLEAHPELELADVAYTLRHGRALFTHRRAVLARTPAEAAAALASLDVARVFTRHQEPLHRPVVFLFPGQGSQHAGMAAALYGSEPVFRAAFDECAELLQPHLAADLRALVFAPPEERDEAERRLAATEITQPALFAVEHSLARLWLSLGVRPRAMIGHSIGEYVAATLAGVMPLPEALALVAERGRLIASLPAGAMLSVSLPAAELPPWLGGGLALAADNGPSLAVVAGPIPEVEDLAARLAAAGIGCRRLRTSHAFHSPMMDPILPRFAERLRRVPLAPPQIPYLSNLTGTWIEAAEATDPLYWVRHLREAVRFGDGIAALLREPEAVLLEVGPGRSLKTLTRWHRDKAPQQVVETSLPHAGEALPDDAFFLGAVGRLWLAGVELDAAALSAGESRRRLSLPTYPFERQTYWVEPLPEGRERAVAASLDRRSDARDWLYLPLWRESPPRAVAPGFAGRRVLLIPDAAGLAPRLARRLAELGATVTIAPEGVPEGPIPGLIFHLGPFGAQGGAAELLAASFTGPFRLAKALAGRPAATGATRLVLVTNGLAPATGAEAVQAEKATLLGVAKVLPRELPGASAVTVDALPPTTEAGWERLVEALLAEVDAPLGERTVALRGRRRFVETYAPLPPAPPSGRGIELRAGGSYLVTGGLGGLGLAVAEWLLERVGAGLRLALLGRTTLPPRAEWEERAREAGPAGERLARLLALERGGAELLTLAADVADPALLAGAFATLHERGFRPDGVVHAAGIAGGGLVRFREEGAAAAVLAPKVAGTRALEAALTEAGLLPSFLVLFSSLAGVVGRAGQMDYGAANAFLDAYAHEAGERLGIPVLSIDWGEWHEVGMAATGAAVAGEALVVADEPFGHPFLERRRRLASGEEVFTTEMSVASHWVLDEHRLVGHAVIPGVAYVEMVRAALGERAAGRLIELQDLLFVGPLRVRDGERRTVRLHLVPEGEGFRFRVESPADAEEGGDGSPRDYALGRAVLRPPAAPAARSLAELVARMTAADKVFTDEDREEDLGPRWQCVRRIRLGEGEALATLELPPELEADLATFAYHPALLDRAAGVAKDHLFTEEFLPLSYHRLRIHAPVPRRIHSHARYRPDADPGRETLTWDTVVMDDEGRVLVEIEGFSQKRINDAAGALRAYASPLAAAAAPERGEMRREEGLAALRLILAAAERIGPQVLVSVRALDRVLAEAGEISRERLLAEAGRQATGARPTHQRPALATAYAAPEGELEATLAAAWEELLGISGVGRLDDYFALGGDSVAAIQIIARLQQQGFELTPQQFFQYPTIAELAAVIAAGAATAAAPARPAFVPLPRLAKDELAALAAASGITELEDAYPASALQRGMLFHHHLAPTAGVYTEQLHLRIDGAFDPRAFESAWRQTIARHPALRTGFPLGAAGEGEGTALQLVSRLTEPTCDEQDWSALSPGEQEARFAELLAADRRRGFDLTRPPLVRLTLIRLAGPPAPAHRALVTTSHLILDGWSMPLVLAEVFAAYRGAQGEAVELPPPPPPPRTYAAWLHAQDAEAASAFWRLTLAGFDAPTPLPGHGLTGGREGEVVTLELALNAADTAALSALARRHRLTVNTLLLGAWALALGRYADVDEVVFGAVVAGRPPALAGADRMVGLFVNTLPLRVRITPREALLTFLARVQADLIAARRYEASSLAEIQALAGLPPRTPLFETLIALENLPDEERLKTEAAVLGVSGIARAPGRTGYPLTVEAFLETELTLHLSYDTGRINGTVLRGLGDYLLALLAALPAAEDGDIAALPAVAPAARRELAQWSGGPPLPPRAATIVELFAEQAAVAPSRPALVWEGGQQTYGELARASDRIAHALVRAGVSPEDRVGVALARSPELIAALLGILKAGAAYVPLDLDGPGPRLAALLAGAGITRVLVGHARVELARAQATPLVYEELLAVGGTPRLANPHPEQLAYVLFTSGSTGLPKAVGVPHRAVARLAVGADYVHLGPGEVLIHLAPLAFDASTLEIWGALCTGALLALPAPGPLSLEAIGGALTRFNVTTLWLTAGLFHQMVAAQPGALAGVRQLLAGGDVLSPAAVARALALPLGGPGRVLVNGYGPTENTTFTTCHRLEPGWQPGVSVPIGRPIAGTRVHVVDHDLALVPMGAAGELVTGGRGLARGYLGQPAATAWRFVPDPYSDRPGERLYRTGDRVCYLPDGTLGFLGRRDGQLKVRGFRVEPGEIEAVLTALPAVEAASVGLWQEEAGAEAKRLAAWVVLAGGMPAEPAAAAAELRAALAELLPEHLLPAACVFLPELPLTTNGKVDRRRLPPPEARPVAFAAPTTEIERTLAELWCRLLGVERVGLADNFFALGGHSLTATQLVAEVRAVLGVTLPLRDAFEAADLRALAERVIAAEVRDADEATLVRLLAEVGEGALLEESRG